MMDTAVLSGDESVFPETLAAVIREFQASGVVALPTETVYGLAADARDPMACAKIFEAKSRPLADPLIVHIPDQSWMHRLAKPNRLAEDLANAFWPGPLTLILPRNAVVPDVVTGGQDTVALRMSAHPMFQKIIAGYGAPLAAPSANRFGKISPTTPAHVMDELGGRIPLIVDGGACSRGIESTIVRVLENELHILRSGPITADQLSAYAHVRMPETSVPITPGSMKSHYAPTTPMEILEPDAVRSMHPDVRMRCGLLLPEPSPALSGGFGHVEHLSLTGDLAEMAATLYAAMRRLDTSGVDRIVTIPVRGDGIGIAIRERLCKASARE